MNAIGCCGLQLYNYGQAVSICFFRGPGTFWPDEAAWRPDSFYEKVQANRRLGLHTLCLLDIKVKEPNMEQLARGRKVWEEPRYMSVNTCIEQMLAVEAVALAGSRPRPVLGKAATTDAPPTRAACQQALSERALLPPTTCNCNPLSKKWFVLIPAYVLTQSVNVTHDHRKRWGETCLLRRLRHITDG